MARRISNYTMNIFLLGEKKLCPEYIFIYLDLFIYLDIIEQILFSSKSHYVMEVGGGSDSLG